MQNLHLHLALYADYEPVFYDNYITTQFYLAKIITCLLP